MATRIEVLQDDTGPAHETAQALARETAALTQAVADARGALAKAAELAARRDGAGAAFVFFVLGLVLQQETSLVSFGDPRDAWNDHVEEHFTPTLAACASEMRLNDEPVLCSMIIDPLPELTVSHYPGVILTEQPPQRPPNLQRSSRQPWSRPSPA